MLGPSYIILRIQRLEANSVDLDEVAHYEPPHIDLCCLHIQLFSSLVLKELNSVLHIKAVFQDNSEMIFLMFQLKHML